MSFGKKEVYFSVLALVLVILGKFNDVENLVWCGLILLLGISIKLLNFLLFESNICEKIKTNKYEFKLICLACGSSNIIFPKKNGGHPTCKKCGSCSSLIWNLESIRNQLNVGEFE